MIDPSKNSEIIDRIKWLMKELNVKQVQLSELIGVDTSNLSKYLNARLPVSDSLVNRLVVNLGVSKDWLLSGGDLPFGRKPIKFDEDGRLIVPDQASVPVYDIDANANKVKLRDQLMGKTNIVGWVSLPQLSPDSSIVRVTGDSMAPIIMDGDFVAVRDLVNKSQIYWGQIYIVQLDDFRMVKYVRRHPDPNMVTLRNANPNYDDIDVKRSDIRDMMIVQAVLRLAARL